MITMTQEQFLAAKPQYGGRIRPDGLVDVYESAEERPVVAAPEVPRLIDAADFRDRFTVPEITAISTLAYNGAGDPLVQVLLFRVATNRDGINLDDPDVIDGLNYLVSKGALAAHRPAEIRA